MRPELRRPESRHPSLSALAVVLVAGFVVYAAQTVGWGFGTGLLLVLAAAAIAYAWKRRRPQRTETPPRPPG